MKTAFYCRVDGQGFGFVLPDEADKLREFFAGHQDMQIKLRIHKVLRAMKRQLVLLCASLLLVLTKTFFGKSLTLSHNITAQYVKAKSSA